MKEQKYSWIELIRYVLNFLFSRKKKQTQRQRKKFRKVVKELDEEYSAIDEAQEKRRERKGLTDRLNNMF